MWDQLLQATLGGGGEWGPPHCSATDRLLEAKYCSMKSLACTSRSSPLLGGPVFTAVFINDPMHLSGVQVMFWRHTQTHRLFGLTTQTVKTHTHDFKPLWSVRGVLNTQTVALVQVMLWRHHIPRVHKNTKHMHTSSHTLTHTLTHTDTHAQINIFFPIQT